MLARKIFRSGNSSVISLPDYLLRELHLEPGDLVYVSRDQVQPGRLIIQPADWEPAPDDPPHLQPPWKTQKPS